MGSWKCEEDIFNRTNSYSCWYRRVSLSTLFFFHSLQNFCSCRCYRGSLFFFLNVGLFNSFTWILTLHIFCIVSTIVTHHYISLSWLTLYNSFFITPIRISFKNSSIILCSKFIIFMNNQWVYESFWPFSFFFLGVNFQYFYFFVFTLATFRYYFFSWSFGSILIFFLLRVSFCTFILCYTCLRISFYILLPQLDVTNLQALICCFFLQEFSIRDFLFLVWHILLVDYKIYTKNGDNIQAWVVHHHPHCLNHIDTISSFIFINTISKKKIVISYHTN